METLWDPRNWSSYDSVLLPIFHTLRTSHKIFRCWLLVSPYIARFADGVQSFLLEGSQYRQLFNHLRDHVPFQWTCLGARIREDLNWRETSSGLVGGQNVVHFALMARGHFLFLFMLLSIPYIVNNVSFTAYVTFMSSCHRRFQNSRVGDLALAAALVYSIPP